MRVEGPLHLQDYERQFLEGAFLDHPRRQLDQVVTRLRATRRRLEYFGIRPEREGIALTVNREEYRLLQDRAYYYSGPGQRGDTFEGMPLAVVPDR